jgi:TonB family protein
MARTTDASAFYDWKVPGAAVHIRISLDAIRRIREYLTEAARRGSERGGLLTGSPHARGPEITDFAPISRGDETEAQFLLSNADKIFLQSHIDEVNRSFGGGSVVGYFRSDLEKGVSLQEEDLKLIAEHFPDPSNVFLVVHFQDADPATAGFFFYDEGQIFSSFSFMEFDFDERILEPQLIPPPREVAPVNDVKEPVEPRAISEPFRSSGEVFSFGGERTPTLPPAIRRWVIPAAAAIVLTGAAGYFYSKRAKTESASGSGAEVTRTRAGTPAGLGLTVAGPGPELSIAWDAKSPVVAGARAGLLTIEDGNERRNLPLTKEQLMSSKLVYSRTTNIVHIALETYAEDGSVAREKVISLGNIASKVAATTPQARVSTTSAPPTLQPSTQQTDRKAAATREFVAPHPRITPTPEKSPSLSVVPPKVAIQLDLRQTPAAPPTNATPPLPSQAGPAPIAASREALNRAVPRGQPRPPVPINQTKPVLPDNVKAMLTHRLTVKVRVRVDSSGRVIAVEPIGNGGSLEKVLGSAAADAARMWTFEPAREGDRRVPSEVTAEFTFAPEKESR